jgi:hypothetical protein
MHCVDNIVLVANQWLHGHLVAAARCFVWRQLLLLWLFGSKNGYDCIALPLPS